MVRRSGSCFWTESADGQPTAIVWPNGFSAEGEMLLDRSGRVVAEVGDAVVLGGGSLAWDDPALGECGGPTRAFAANVLVNCDVAKDDPSCP